MTKKIEVSFTACYDEISLSSRAGGVTTLANTTISASMTSGPPHNRDRSHNTALLLQYIERFSHGSVGLESDFFSSIYPVELVSVHALSAELMHNDRIPPIMQGWRDMQDIVGEIWSNLCALSQVPEQPFWDRCTLLTRLWRSLCYEKREGKFRVEEHT